MSLAGLAVFRQSLLGVRGVIAGGVAPSVCVPLRGPARGRRSVSVKGDCGLGFDNLALPYSAVRSYATKRMETDESEYEDEE